MRRFCFLHPNINSLSDFKKYLKIGDELDGIELIWDLNNPEICFATEVIYTNSDYWKLFKKISKVSKINVFYSIEAMTIDLNLFDIGITFDSTLCGHRFCQVLPPEDNYNGFLTKYENDIKTLDQAKGLLTNKKFCNFLYSNYNAHPMRDHLFYEISKYKKVDSLGKHLNNVGIRGTGWYGHALDCVKIKSNYKFSIACENAWFPGYTTEKLLTSLEAHTVPIYFGNKDVALDVNPECFINVMEYDNIEDVIDRIKEIDTNDDLWCEMISKPWYVEKQQKNKENRRQNYFKMMKRIFADDIENLRYRGDGSMEYIYRDFINRKGVQNKYESLLRSFMKKIKKGYLGFVI